MTVFLLFSADYSAVASAEVPENDSADPNFAAKRKLRCKRIGIFKEDDLKMSRLRAYFLRHSAPRFALSSLFYFVCRQQTIVWSDHTIVWWEQTFVWREQTKRDLSHRAVQGLFRQGVPKSCSRLMRRGDISSQLLAPLGPFGRSKSA